MRERARNRVVPALEQEPYPDRAISRYEEDIMVRYAFAFAAVAAFAMPAVADAQGLVGGAEQGYHAGDRALGPVGGIVGGAVGAGVGTVNGALGIHPRYYRHHRCYFRHGRRFCRY